jgi:hypothetical protein
VLLAGGIRPKEGLSAARYPNWAVLYDPATGAVAPAAPMTAGRDGAAALLPDGRVLLVSGVLWTGTGIEFTDVAVAFTP